MRTNIKELSDNEVEMNDYLNDLKMSVILNEGYVLSDKTLAVNLDDFESGKKKKLLIVGTSGSGKSTLGEKLAKKYKVKWLSLDFMWWRLRQKHFKNAPKTEETERKLIEKVIQFTFQLLKSNERMIIEGVDLLNIYSEKPEHRKLINSQPMIIFGLSSLRAGIRAGMRNKDRKGGEGWKELYLMAKFNMKHIEPSLKLLRNDIRKNSKNIIKEFEIPKL